MKTFAILFLGVCLGFTLAQFTPNGKAADDLKITGESGILLDYDVIRNGETICSEPFVATKTQTIECD